MTIHPHTASPERTFDPATPQARFDGWTPLKQIDFVEALAESGCVTEAARAVGMSVRSAYRLRQRGDAVHFALAWETALDQAIRRLADVALSRALNGVATPVFYKGEQIGERRKYDENLTRFLLRIRAPELYKDLPRNMTIEHLDYEGVLFDRRKEALLNPEMPLPSLEQNDEDNE